MASAYDIALLLTAAAAPPAGNSDLGYDTGVVVSWDELSAANTIKIRDTNFNNLRTIQSGVGVLYQPGDVLSLLRFQTTYLILGKVGAVGAGAALQIRSQTVPNLHNVNTPSGGFGDLPTFGPDLQSVYIGSTRRCLITLSGYFEGNGSYANMGFQVTGASSISPSLARVATSGSTSLVNVGSASTFHMVLTSSDGLNQGMNNFTAKYQVQLFGGTGAIFSNRTMTVQPF